MSSIAARRAHKRVCPWQPNEPLSRGTHGILAQRPTTPPRGAGRKSTALELPYGLLSTCALADRHLSTITSLEVLQHPSINLQRDSPLVRVHTFDCRRRCTRRGCPIGGNIVVRIQTCHPLTACHLGPVMRVKPRCLFEPFFFNI